MNIAQTFSRSTFPLWGSLLLGGVGGIFFYYFASSERSTPRPAVTNSFSATEKEVKKEVPFEKDSEKVTEEEALPELPGLPPLAEVTENVTENPAVEPVQKTPPELSTDFLEEVWMADQALSPPVPGNLQDDTNLPELPREMVAKKADWAEIPSKEGGSEFQQVHFEEPVSPRLPTSPNSSGAEEKINRLPPPPPAEEIPIFNPDLLEMEGTEEAVPISRLDPATLSPALNADVLVSTPLRETVSLEARNTDLRLLLSRVEEQSGLKIYASPEVQGKVSCKVESRESEEIFRRLLGTTSFTAWREGELVYIGRRTEQETLPKPLSLRGSRTFVPQHISLEQLRKTVEANLSPYGETSLANNTLTVHDLEVTLRDLEKIVALLDVQGKVPKWDIFIFQHDAPSRKQSLDLQKIAENRGLSLQETTPQWLVPEKSRKKEELPGRLFSISHRIDTFLIGLEDQKKVQLISDRSADSDLELEHPRQFPFSLNLGEKKENYVAEVTFSTPDDAEIPPGTLAVKVDCRPQSEKTKGERWTFQTTMEMERGLLWQGFLTEYKPEKEENKPFQAFPGKKTPVEIVLTLVTRLEEPPRPETTLSSAAIKYLAKQQETIGCKILETALGEERKCAQTFLQTSQRLRNLVYDVQIR
ncbi:MAG: hypothetical protein Q4D62_08730 [Planctomycetia bacterium]|nr:hypothetical protein [Planctomycetia bacterium]